MSEFENRKNEISRKISLKELMIIPQLGHGYLHNVLAVEESHDCSMLDSPSFSLK